MPIYKGNVEIDKVYKGATELDNIQIGNAQQWIGIIVTPEPTIAILSTTQTTVTVRLTNTHTEEVTIFYEANDSTPDAFSAVVPASSFVDRTITGLSIGSAQTIYAYALETNQLPSQVISLSTSTLAQATPGIESVAALNGNTIRFRLRNNNAETTIVRYAISGSDPISSSPGVSVAAGALSGNINVGSQPTNTLRTIRVATFINNVKSGVSQSTVTTPQNAPTISNVVTTSNSITFRLKNNNSQSSVVRASLGTNPISSSTPAVTLNSGVTSGDLSFTGLSGGTTFSLRAAAFISNISGPVSTTSTTTPVNLGPGPTSLIAGNTTTGFYGETTQTQFGRSMSQIMSDLGITQGFELYSTDPLFKFVHNGKIKFINKRTIRRTVSWNHIQNNFQANGGDVSSGVTMTFGGQSYKVRLMRGWGQVVNSTAQNFVAGIGGNSGVNFPSNTSGWSASNPNEWNTLIFPIAASGKTQTQTTGIPNWANYSNSDLNTGATSAGSAIWCQEETSQNRYLQRGYGNIADASGTLSNSAVSFLGLRLVFELI